MFNQQILFGDNVLTRINLCQTDTRYVEKLHDAFAKQTLLPLIEKICDGYTDAVDVVTVCGNSTMLHLAVGVDPSTMGIAPFTPTFLEHRLVEASELMGDALPKTLHASVPVHLLPGAAAYVGADIVGGCLVSSMRFSEPTAVLVDIGTNGEMALKHGDQLVGCATAAGPAFEGQGLSSGMRATNGAICNVTFDTVNRSIAFETINGGHPVGLCGSAYVDLIGDGRRKNILDERGRFTPDALDIYADHIRQSDAGLHLVVHHSSRADVTVSEHDIAQLLQAKAAIAAGIQTLLHAFHLTQQDVDTLYVAGGFGMHLDIENAINSGLLPGFDPAQIQRIGNASLGTAFAAALDASMLTELSAIGHSMKVVELNTDPHFENAFLDHLMI